MTDCFIFWKMGFGKNVGIFISSTWASRVVVSESDVPGIVVDGFLVLDFLLTRFF